MIARVPRIGRLAFTVAALLVGVGCVHEYNPQLISAESDALSNVSQLTDPGGAEGFDRAGQGRFSPDGRWIVFRGVPHGSANANYGLYLARVHWSGERGDPDRHVVTLERATRITRPGVRVGGACFSPDGFILAFSAATDPSTPTSPAPMRLYRVDGWEQHLAMTDSARGIDLAQHPITPADLSTDECDWSPNGKSICFAATPTGGKISLYAVHPDGSHLVHIGPAAGFARGPSFSLDGHRLTYRADISGLTQTQIFAADVQFDAEGAVEAIVRPQLLTNETGVTFSDPCWFGKDHILYATNRHGDTDLYIMDANGQRKTRLTLTPGPDLLPSVAPDGHNVLWTRGGASEAPPQLFAAELDLPPGS